MQLRKAAISSVKWAGLSQIVRQVVQFGSLAILAGLLNPDDFGLLAMAVVVTGFMELFKDLGTRVAIIKQEGATEAFLSSIFWVNLGIGAVAFVLLVIASPLVASFYEEPRLNDIILVLALSFPISSLSISIKANLEKMIAFGIVGIIEATGAIVGAAIAVILAFLGWGVWSLVFQQLASATIITLLSWILSDWRPHFIFQWQAIKGVLGYSLNYTGYTVLNYIARNMDYVLIGRFLGKESLGYYTLAYRIMVYPIQNISLVIGRVMFPVLSRVQNDNTRVAEGYLQVVSGIALVAFPIMLGLLSTASPFVRVLLGDQWLPVISLLMILAPVGMAQSIVSTVGALYLIKNRTGWLFGWGAISSLVIAGAFIIGIPYGIEGVAWSYAAASLLLFYPSVRIPTGFIELPLSKVFKAMYRPLLSSLIMLGVVLIMRHYFRPSETAMAWAFAGFILTGVLIYTGATLLFNRAQIKQLYTLLMDRGSPHATARHS